MILNYPATYHLSYNNASSKKVLLLHYLFSFFFNVQYENVRIVLGF